MNLCLKIYYFEKVFQYDIIKVQKHILNVVDDIILIKDNVNDSVWISNIINNIPKDIDIVYLGENKDIQVYYSKKLCKMIKILDEGSKWEIDKKKIYKVPSQSQKWYLVFLNKNNWMN